MMYLFILIFKTHCLCRYLCFQTPSPESGERAIILHGPCPPLQINAQPHTESVIFWLCYLEWRSLSGSLQVE